jgi:hypothetical protein
MDKFSSDTLTLCKDSFQQISTLNVPKNIQDSFLEYVITHYITFDDLKFKGIEVWEDVIKNIYTDFRSCNSKQVELKAKIWKDHFALNDNYQDAFIYMQMYRDNAITEDQFHYAFGNLLMRIYESSA